MLLYALYITHIIYICLYLLYLYYIVLYSVPVLFGHISFCVNISAQYSLVGLLFFLRRYHRNTRILYSTCYNYTICIIAVIYLYYRYYLYKPIRTAYIFTPYIHSLYSLYSVRALYIVRIYINIIFSLYIFSPPWR